MFHRFNSAVDVARYINKHIVNALSFSFKPDAATEYTVRHIVAFFEAENCSPADILAGRPPLDVEKWISNLYTDIDSIPVDKQEEYLAHIQGPNALLYSAITLFYQSKYDVMDDDADKLDDLVDPTE